MEQILWLCFTVSFAFARSSGTVDIYPIQKIAARGLTSIQITGVKGTLKLSGHAQSKFLGLKVKHSSAGKYADWHLSVERRGSILYLEVFNVAYGAQWKTQVKAEMWPEFDIELEGPSLPTTVGWREGNLEFNNWDSNLDISFLKGVALVTGGKGSLVLQPVQANVQVRERQGDVKIKGESGIVSLARIDGDLKLSWLNGNVSLKDCRGSQQIELSESQFLAEGGGGKLGLQLSKGRARIAGFSGVVDGKGQIANWTISARAPSDLNLTTTAGSVEVSWLGGGVHAFLTSTQGTIQFPPNGFLKSTDLDGQKTVEGMSSAKSMGQVFVRTVTGAIVWH